MKSKWVLVQQAVDARRAGKLDEHARILSDIEKFEVTCPHKRRTAAECDREAGDTLHLCTRCGKVLARIPSDKPSGVRLRV